MWEVGRREGEMGVSSMTALRSGDSDVMIGVDCFCFRGFVSES